MEPTPTEFEIKAAIENIESIADILKTLSFRSQETNEDVYFDTKDRQLFRHGCFLRLRNSKVFEIKYNPDASDLRHIVCNERKFDWPLDAPSNKTLGRFLAEDMGLKSLNEKEALDSFGLSEFVRVKKSRAVYTGDEIEVSIDNVEGLGAFVEVEAKGTQGAQKATLFCKKHGLRNLPIGYVELWLRKYDHAEYLQGKYVLDGDR